MQTLQDVICTCIWRSKIHAPMCSYTQKTHISRAIHQYAQIGLPSDILTLFLMLLISMSPNFCNGACANVYPQSRPHTNPAEYKYLEPHTAIIPLYVFQYFELSTSSAPSPSVLAAIQSGAHASSATNPSNPSVLAAIQSGA